MASDDDSSPRTVTLLDYGAGNVRSVWNALRLHGCVVKEVRGPEDIDSAQVLVFPGVGSFGPAVEKLRAKGVTDALRRYLSDPSRPFLGICLGLQLLFEGSEECPGTRGLGVFRGTVGKFDASKASVPHMGWNRAAVKTQEGLFDAGDRFYFVHSYRVSLASSEDARNYACGVCTYAGDDFVAALQRGNQTAVQFHPEKSAQTGLALLGRFLRRSFGEGLSSSVPPSEPSSNNKNNNTDSDALPSLKKRGLARRVVCALDVRENDAGDLVVTKGDAYDVREKTDVRAVRNLGKPVELAARYYEEGADEIAVLNICAFKGEPVADLPLLDVLRRASERCFVPLTIGGGVREYVTKDGVTVDPVDVAAAYFRAGADKVAIGSDAVRAAERYYANDARGDGASSIERIAEVYGSQAVVVSVDPRRAWLGADDADVKDRVAVDHSTARGPNGETRCWYRCTVSGGRKDTNLDAVRLCQAVEALGAGELMLNCIDTDGKGTGFELDLVKLVKSSVSIPVIASSGAGAPDHFVSCFEETDCEAALAAGIFHRREVPIADVKRALHAAGLAVRDVVVSPSSSSDNSDNSSSSME